MKRLKTHGSSEYAKIVSNKRIMQAAEKIMGDNVASKTAKKTLLFIVKKFLKLLITSF